MAATRENTLRLAADEQLRTAMQARRSTRRGPHAQTSAHVPVIHLCRASAMMSCRKELWTKTWIVSAVGTKLARHSECAKERQRWPRAVIVQKTTSPHSAARTKTTLTAEVTLRSESLNTRSALERWRTFSATTAV